MTVAAPIRFAARLENWRPVSRLDGPNAPLHWRDKAKRKQVVADIIAAGLHAAGWPRDGLKGAAGVVITFTVFQKTGPLPDDDNARGMLKDTRDSVCAYVGLAVEVIRRKGARAGSGWLRARDDAGGARFEYVWLRGRTDAVEIVVERLAGT